MDAHIAESSTLRERSTENEEKLRKKKQQRERNYGVGSCCFCNKLVIAIIIQKLLDFIGDCIGSGCCESNKSANVF